MYAKYNRVTPLNKARVDEPCVENCAHPGYYAASSGNFLATVRDHYSLPSFDRKSAGVRHFATGARNQTLCCSTSQVTEFPKFPDG